MQYGIQFAFTDESAPPAEVASRVEEAGFESLFVTEQTHIPASRETPYPGGGDLPRAFYRILDPFVSLATAAAVTTRLRLGTGVCLAAQHDPIVLAKVTATLDYLSSGRLLLGVGAGWNVEQMRAHGVDPDRRFARLEQSVLAVRALWTEDPAEFHGSQIDIVPSHQYPKPVQTPSPPVLVGGRGPRVLERVLRFGDGWMPNPGHTMDELGSRIRELRTEAANRGQSRPSVTMYRATPEAEELGQYRDAGVDRCVFRVASRDREQIEAELHELGALVRDFEARE